MTDPLEVICEGTAHTLTGDRWWYVSVCDGTARIVDSPDLAAQADTAASIRFFTAWVLSAQATYSGPPLLVDGKPVGFEKVRLAGTVRLSAGRPATVPPRSAAQPVLSGAAFGQSRAAPPGRMAARRRLVIGRDGADISTTDMSVATRHAELVEQANGRWMVRRLDGDIIIDGRSYEFAFLSPGGQFRAGSLLLEVPADGSTPRPAGAAAAPTVHSPIAAKPQRTAAATGAVLSARDASFRYPDRRERLRLVPGDVAVDEVSFDIRPGTFTAVIGPSGAGKTSLAHALLRDFDLVGGELTVDGTSVAHPDYREGAARVVRFVPQGDALYDRLSVRETLRYAAHMRAEPETDRRSIRRTVEEVAAKVDLTHRLDAPPAELSGGERRRLSIATELVARPRLLLLDEPTSGLDPGKDRAVMATLRTLADEGTTVICITHSLENVAIADRLILLGRNRRIVYDGAASGPDAAGYASWADAMEYADGLTPRSSAGRETVVVHPDSPVDGRPARPKPRRVLGALIRRQLALLRGRGAVAFAAVLVVAALGAGLGRLADPGGLAGDDHIGPGVTIATVCAALIGLSLGYTELVVERQVLLKDWRVGVAPWKVVVAKFLVSSIPTVIAAGGLGAVLAVPQLQGPRGLGNLPAWVAAVVPLVVLAEASLALGLAVATVSPSLDRAVTYSTALTIVQVVVNGLVFSIPAAVGRLSVVLPVRDAVDSLMSWVPPPSPASAATPASTGSSAGAGPAAATTATGTAAVSPTTARSATAPSANGTPPPPATTATATASTTAGASSAPGHPAGVVGVHPPRPTDPLWVHDLAHFVLPLAVLAALTVISLVLAAAALGRQFQRAARD